MKIGVPTEIKPSENRVAMVPAGVDILTQDGHTVCVQEGAGLGSGIADAEFVAAGAKILPDADAVFAKAETLLAVEREAYRATKIGLRSPYLVSSDLARSEARWVPSGGNPRARVAKN